MGTYKNVEAQVVEAVRDHDDAKIAEDAAEIAETS